MGAHRGHYPCWPAYVEEDSIEDPVADGEKYDFGIVGIDPGAGMMQQLEEAIAADTVGPGAFTLLEGSGPTMTAALADAVDNQDPIVVTGRRPRGVGAEHPVPDRRPPAGDAPTRVAHGLGAWTGAACGRRRARRKPSRAA
ncbi:MAG: glycine betaine ABC transporter substrate-binding protein [Spirochaetota bacterium]